IPRRAPDSPSTLRRHSCRAALSPPHLVIDLLHHRNRAEELRLIRRGPGADELVKRGPNEPRPGALVLETGAPAQEQDSRPVQRDTPLASERLDLAPQIVIE